MSRYACHLCKSEHGTDNMVAYCASRFAAVLDGESKVRHDLMDILAHAEYSLLCKLNVIGNGFLMIVMEKAKEALKGQEAT